MKRNTKTYKKFRGALPIDRNTKTYEITQYSYNRAKKLGVTIKRSTNPTKKLDVFKGNKKIVSIGALGYGDFPTFTIREGNVSAKKHRKRYKMRHEKDRHRKGTSGYYADQILW